MEIKEITNKIDWENFLQNCADKTFVDSWNWGEFLQKEGSKIWRLGVFENDKLLAIALVDKIVAKRGTFLFIPHGPNIDLKSQISNLKSQILDVLLEKFKEIAKQEKAGFIRIAPIWPARNAFGIADAGGNRTIENNDIFKKLGFIAAPIHMHPELTWELDITKSEDELLKDMRKTTRYLIRQAVKNPDVKIIKSSSIFDIDKFSRLYEETAQRHHFFKFSDNYLKNEFSSFSNDNQILILFGEYKGEIVSGAIIVFWQDMAFYHHGASISEQKVPVSYLLQMEAIKEAKQRGCRSYNFWGIAPGVKEKSDIAKLKHPWAGLTLFKMGFGGEIKEYVKTQDFPISTSYWLTYIFEKLRKIRRGL